MFLPPSDTAREPPVGNSFALGEGGGFFLPLGPENRRGARHRTGQDGTGGQRPPFSCPGRWGRPGSAPLAAAPGVRVPAWGPLPAALPAQGRPVPEGRAVSDGASGRGATREPRGCRTGAPGRRAAGPGARKGCGVPALRPQPCPRFSSPRSSSAGPRTRRVPGTCRS